MEQCMSNGWAKQLTQQPIARTQLVVSLFGLLVFLHLSAALPAGDTPVLLYPPKEPARQADQCTQPWLSHQPLLCFGASAY